MECGWMPLTGMMARVRGLRQRAKKAPALRKAPEKDSERSRARER